MPLSNRGYCPICRTITTFIATGEWLRDSYLCPRCHSIPRQRALVHVLESLLPDWRAKTVHESSPTLGYFAEQCAGYSCSFYFEDTTLGALKGTLRCESLESLTFADGHFDLFITQDVLEHVVCPDRALAEISRVLKPGGMHVFTTPKHKDLLQSRARVQPDGDGVRYLSEPVYHGNPIGDGRSLVTWDYGADFESLLHQWSGYLTSTYVIRDRRIGVDGEFLEVFVTVKDPVNAISAPMAT